MVQEELSDRNIERKDNYFCIPVIDGDLLVVSLNGKEVVKAMCPMNGKLRCYLSSDRKPFIFETGD